jgi:DNA-binding MarR family transcriptional regulator
MSVLPTALAPAFDLNLAPGHLIRRAHQLAVAQFNSRCAAFDLTSVQFGALSAIALQEGIDQARLAQHLALDAVTVGSVLMRLENKQLIERRLDKMDKRRKCLHTRPTAKRLLRDVTPMAQAAQLDILSPFTAQESRQFMMLVQKLVQSHESTTLTNSKHSID